MEISASPSRSSLSGMSSYPLSRFQADDLDRFGSLALADLSLLLLPKRPIKGTKAHLYRQGLLQDGITSSPSSSLYVSIPAMLLLLVRRTDHQLLMITAALGILFVPEEFGRSLLPERYERPTAGMGNTIRGQMVFGGVGSCKFTSALPDLTKSQV